MPTWCQVPGLAADKQSITRNLQPAFRELLAAVANQQQRQRTPDSSLCTPVAVVGSWAQQRQTHYNTHGGIGRGMRRRAVTKNCVQKKMYAIQAQSAAALIPLQCAELGCGRRQPQAMVAIGPVARSPVSLLPSRQDHQAPADPVSCCNQHQCPVRTAAAWYQPVLLWVCWFSATTTCCAACWASHLYQSHSSPEMQHTVWLTAPVHRSWHQHHPDRSLFQDCSGRGTRLRDSMAGQHRQGRQTV